MAILRRSTKPVLHMEKSLVQVGPGVGRGLPLVPKEPEKAGFNERGLI